MRTLEYRRPTLVCTRPIRMVRYIIICSKLSNFMCVYQFRYRCCLCHGQPILCIQWMLPFILLPFSYTIPHEKCQLGPLLSTKAIFFRHFSNKFPPSYARYGFGWIAHGLWWLFPLSIVIIIIIFSMWTMAWPLPALGQHRASNGKFVHAPRVLGWNLRSTHDWRMWDFTRIHSDAYKFPLSVRIRRGTDFSNGTRNLRDPNPFDLLIKFINLPIKI